MNQKTARIDWNSEAARHAREFGIDLLLTEQNLALTPTERLEKHQAWVNEVIELQKAFRR